MLPAVNTARFTIEVVMGSAAEPEIPGIGTAAQRIRQDVVYLDQMS